MLRWVGRGPLAVAATASLSPATPIARQAVRTLAYVPAETKRLAIEKRNKAMELKAAANLAKSGKSDGAEGEAAVNKATGADKASAKAAEEYVFLPPGAALREIAVPEIKRNFVETVEVVFNTRLDTRKQDQQMRLTADLPKGTGKDANVVVFTTLKQAAEDAKTAGADHVGGLELVEQVKDGSLKPTFDKALATPEMVPALASIAKILGPRGLMPSVKLGTVAHDVVTGVKKAKAGSVMLRADKSGVIKCAIGNITMKPDALLENLKSVVLSIENAKPMGIKGNLLKSVYMKSTMGKTKRILLDRVSPKSPRFMSDEAPAPTPTR